MESIISLEKTKNPDASSESSDRSFLISPDGQKMLLMCTLDVEGLYKHIALKDQKSRFRYLINPGSLLKQGRYRVKKIIGKGSFGSVVEAYDEYTRLPVAVKIVKMKPGVTIHTSNEITSLKKLSQNHEENSLFVELLDYFEENGFLCIVLEFLQKTLLQYLMEVKMLSLPEIIPISQQLFKALLAMQEVGLVHCDLKPENIMVKITNKTTIKVIDLGSSCEVGRPFYKFVQSRFYRAPEVTLHLEYGPAIDIWSAACIVSELYIGSPLFGSRNEHTQMSKTVSILGPLPRSMLERSRGYRKYYNLTRSEIRPTNSLKNHIINSRKNGEEQMAMLDRLVDLISKCLVYEPANRISPQDALNHPFLHSLRLAKSEVPWPSFYTTIFLSQKQAEKKKSVKGIRSNSIIADNSPVSNQSTAVSGNSPRVMSSDEEVGNGEGRGSSVTKESG